MGYPKWTVEEMAALRQLLDEGCTDGEAAEELNHLFGTSRTELGICQTRYRNRIPSSRRGRPSDPARDSLILTHLSDGRSLRWIAERVGTSVADLRRVMVRMIKDGLVRRVGGPTRAGKYEPTLKWVRDDVGDRAED